MSIWGAASALGGATGVLSGGLLTGFFGWSSVFFVTVPVSVSAVLLARQVLHEGARGARRRLDGPGAVTITGAVLALVHGALGAAGGDVIAPSVLLSLAAFVVLAALFLVIERRTDDPLVPLDLFRSRILSTGVALAVLGGAARASTFVLVALYLQQGLAMAPQQAGLAMVPTSLTGFAVSLALLPRMVRAIGPGRSLVVGLVVLAAGQLWLAHPPFDGGYAAAVLPALFLVAVGVALSFTPTTMVIASAAPAAHAGLASGLAGSATQVGAALGTAAFTAVGIAAGGSAHMLGSAGFSAAFTAAAAVALTTAALGATIARARP
jgi:predicted MFS family arabinose efflux permease